MKNSSEKLTSEKLIFIIKPNELSASVATSVCAPGPGTHGGK